MPLVVLALGMVVSLSIAAVVSADAAHRAVSRRRRLLSAAAVAAVALGSFLLPYAYADSFAHLYLHRVKPTPVVAAPYELLLLHAGVGVAGSAAAVLGYVVGTRSRVVDGVR